MKLAHGLLRAGETVARCCLDERKDLHSRHGVIGASHVEHVGHAVRAIGNALQDRGAALACCLRLFRGFSRRCSVVRFGIIFVAFLLVGDVLGSVRQVTGGV